MKPRPIVIGNWKMNPASHGEAKKLFSQIKRASNTLKKVDVVIAAPFPYISLLHTDSKKFLLGAQNVSGELSGALTGEVSASMLRSLDVSYVIVGHSERRAMGESDEMVNKKIKTALGAGMKAVVCIGEKTRDTSGTYLSFLRGQILGTLAGLSKRDLQDVVLAYEPIWAIGSASKGAMDANSLHETTLYIQKILSEIYGREGTSMIPILYGGSVDESNAESLLTEGKIRGFLVGRASLSRETFLPIVMVAEKMK